MRFIKLKNTYISMQCSQTKSHEHKRKVLEKINVANMQFLTLQVLFISARLRENWIANIKNGVGGAISLIFRSPHCRVIYYWVLRHWRNCILTRNWILILHLNWTLDINHGIWMREITTKVDIKYRVQF